MAKIVSFISTKGSVGKTSLSIQIAGYLASRGKKVLLIDADSQQSLSGFIGDFCRVQRKKAYNANDERQTWQYSLAADPFTEK